MKSWIKGGVVGIGVLVMFSIIALILENSGQQSGGGTWFSIVFIPGVFLTYFATDQIRQSFFLLGLISAIIYFLVGALIGLIIGKIKSKK